MCSNYEPVTRADRLLTFFGVTRAPGEPPLELQPDVWPLGTAPFIRRAEPGSSARRVLEVGQFGLLPSFAKEVAFGRRTYNARSETVATLASFKAAWASGQRCIVPAEAVYEPCYDTGRAVRWRIGKPGVYRRWRAPNGDSQWTFAMLTVSGAGHPVYERMHKPGDEKRMVLILDPAEYDRWLQCPVSEAASFFRQWTEPLEASAAPLPPRGRLVPAQPLGGQGQLL